LLGYREVYEDKVEGDSRLMRDNYDTLCANRSRIAVDSENHAEQKKNRGFRGI